MDCDIAHNVGQCLIPEQNHQPTRNYKKFISNDIHFFQSKTHGFPRILGGFPITKKKGTNEPPGVGGQRKGEMCGAKKRAKAWAKSHPEPRFLNAQCALVGETAG
jgi:hypothetical protein